MNNGYRFNYFSSVPPGKGAKLARNYLNPREYSLLGKRTSTDACAFNSKYEDITPVLLHKIPALGYIRWRSQLLPQFISFIRNDL